MNAEMIAASASVVASLTGLVVAYNQLKTLRAVGGVHREVKTANGLTVAALLDREEGRRIRDDVLTSEQTSHERRYVEKLEAEENEEKE